MWNMRVECHRPSLDLIGLGGIAVVQCHRTGPYLYFRTCKTLAIQAFYDAQTTETLGIEEPRNMLLHH